MKYDFDHTPERRNSECFKWQTYQPDVIPMWVADMDFPSPQPVIDALVNRAAHGVYGYPRGLHGSPDELTELRQVVVDRLYNRYKWQVEPEALIFIPGVVTAVNLACLAFAGVNAGVLVQTPVYTPILKAAHTTRAISQEMELTRCSDGSYTVDWEQFEAAIQPNTRLFILCNPHNPVGKVFQPDELEKLAQICLRHNVLICSDEIHSDLIYTGHKHTPIASLDPEIAAHSMTFIAPSKTFNLAGLQCSVAIIQNETLRKEYLAARKGIVPWVNLMGLIAAKAAYSEGQEWLDQLLVYLQANRDFLQGFISAQLPGIELGPVEGTYLAWLNCRNASFSGNPYEFFLKNARVAFNNGSDFGNGGDGFIRLNFGCSRSQLEQTLWQMKQALAVR